MIAANELSKDYHLYAKPIDRLWRKYHTHHALKPVSFCVESGETLGIIGQNGSGKSTLLQLICGILTPTSGTVNAHGRVAALLELGSGFNPEFTGRENIYLNASILGLTKTEINQYINHIIRFAEIGEFIDRPIKLYSSGMVVRLAFAVSTQINPDILIIDEALAVGDARFQAKCFDRLRELKAKGCSIILVTHDRTQIVTHCDRALLLHRGECLNIGEPKAIVNQYMALTHQVHNDTTEYRWGDGAGEIIDYDLPNGSEITTGARLDLYVKLRFNQPIIQPILGVTIKTKAGIEVYGTNSQLLNINLPQAPGEYQIKASLLCTLAPGDYFISLGLASAPGEEIIPHDRRYDVIQLTVISGHQFYGLTDLQMDMSIC